MANPTLDFSSLPNWPTGRVGEPYSVTVPLDLDGEVFQSIETVFPTPNWINTQLAGSDIQLSGVPNLIGTFTIGLRLYTDVHPNGYVLNVPAGGPDLTVMSANVDAIDEEQQYFGYKDMVLMPGEELSVSKNGVPDPDMTFTNADPVESVRFIVNAAGTKVGEPPSINTTPPAAQLGFGIDTFSYNADADGATPLSWFVVSGPPGFSINTVSGLCSWVPTGEGLFNARIRAENLAGHDEQDIPLDVIIVAPTWLTDPYADALVLPGMTTPVDPAPLAPGESYRYDMEVSGSPTITMTITDYGTVDPGDVNLVPLSPTRWRLEVVNNMADGNVHTLILRAENTGGSADQSINIELQM